MLPKKEPIFQQRRHPSHHFSTVGRLKPVSRSQSIFRPSGCFSRHAATISFFVPLPFGRPFPSLHDPLGCKKSRIVLINPM